MVDVNDMFDDEIDCASYGYSHRERDWPVREMTHDDDTPKNTDRVPVTHKVELAAHRVIDVIDEGGQWIINNMYDALTAAINASTELTALITENERMREATKRLIDVAMRNTDDGDEWERVINEAKQAIGE